ncbi:TDP-N-acetylfucosamine:lipid II N-acetylfucosaminyltransferase [Aliidiomarina maris]|uniref:4-alpha-L-fucosyltransferase (Glycosyl transferase family 56) n=1 Tax=Aliidiomarina maris TaxID=531312 RepID=A0A327WQD8_9GAMM|nr:TDP-N-acetylfucosamine:lipid II N-acetylfucosaminyltransferase [Aliidiomarina maris]RAJ93638.1 4-alpha-L-fucosyltransferase (glycosyl transferase family 56) [Aliidiomarina maris]
MILHVAGLDKFIPPFVKLIKEEFEEEKHQFWLTGSVEKYPVEQSESVHVCGGAIWRKLAGYAELVKQLHSARKVMLHGLFNIRVVLVLALCPWVLPKCYWVIWGGDLYQFRKADNTWQSHIKEALRRFVIRRVGHLVTYIEGDVELARQWYGAKGIYHECIMYLSNVVDPKMTAESAPASDHDGLNILLGNSADPSNNHIEALERLLPFKDQAIKIYAPLSYGDQNHAKKVISQGRAWFGDKFVPMTDFMPFEQYLEFLKSLDIAIFNHQRQQAMGNTITLLGMGKTVFMRSDVSQWRFLKGLGIKLNDVEKLEPCRIARDEADENARVVQSYFSKATLIKQLADIFEG